MKDTKEYVSCKGHRLRPLTEFMKHANRIVVENRVEVRGER